MFVNNTTTGFLEDVYSGSPYLAVEFPVLVDLPKKTQDPCGSYSEKNSLTEDEHEDHKGEDTDFEPTTQCAYKDLDKFADEYKIDIKSLISAMTVDITLPEDELETNDANLEWSKVVAEIRENEISIFGQRKHC